MADDLPPLPLGYYLDPNEAAAAQNQTPASPAPATPLTPPSQQPVPPVPPGYYTTPEAANAANPPPPQAYRGGILPWSIDAQGNRRFDPHAGVIGAAIDAFTLPGDVLTGRQPTPYTGGSAPFHPSADPNNLLYTQPWSNPDDVNALLQRTVNLASFINPQLRGNEIVPGTFASRVGPDAAALKATSDAGYAAARANPTTVPSSTVSSVAQNIQQTLQQGDLKLTARTAPKTFDALDNLANQKGPLSYTDLEATRRELSGIGPDPVMGKSDVLAARHAIDEIDKNLIDPNFPEAATARANAAAGFRANTITGDLTQANTGVLEKADTAAALRRRVSTLTQNEDAMRGFSPEEIQTLTDFAKGSGGSVEKVGNILGGAWGKVLSAGTGALIGAGVGEGRGAELGFLAGPLLGSSFKSWANQRATNALDAIAQALRSRSPLGEVYLDQNIRAPSGLLNQVTPPALFSGLLGQPLPTANNLSQPAPLPPQQSQPANVAPAPPAPAGSHWYWPPSWAPDRSRPRFAPLPTTGPIPAGLLGPWA